MFCFLLFCLDLAEIAQILISQLWSLSEFGSNLGAWCLHAHWGTRMFTSLCVHNILVSQVQIRESYLGVCLWFFFFFIIYLFTSISICNFQLADKSPLLFTASQSTGDTAYQPHEERQEKRAAKCTWCPSLQACYRRFDTFSKPNVE